jgi:hypothetical protein
MLVLCLIFSFIVVLGVAGNTIVLFVIGINRQLHDSTNILIANLALADLCFLIFCIPLTAYSYVYPWDFGERICYWMVSLQYITCYVSVWTLVLLAYDRYLSITSPTKLRSIRRGFNSIYVCIFVWALMFLINYPAMAGAGLIKQEFNVSFMKMLKFNPNWFLGNRWILLRWFVGDWPGKSFTSSRSGVLLGIQPWCLYVAVEFEYCFLSIACEDIVQKAASLFKVFSKVN